MTDDIERSVHACFIDYGHCDSLSLRLICIFRIFDIKMSDLPVFLEAFYFRMSEKNISFSPCPSGQILLDPEAASLNALHQARVVQQFTPIPMYVKFDDYVGLMENFINVSALKKVAVEESTHYRALLVLRERADSSVSLMKLGELEAHLSSILFTAQTFQKTTLDGLKGSDMKILKNAYASLVKSLEDISPVQDLASFMKDLKVERASEEKERLSSG